jgi:hypothetical protein
MEAYLLGGDDQFSYTGEGTLGGPDTVPPDLLVDLGAGNDSFTVSARLELHDPPAEHAWHIDILAGAGNDRVESDIESSMALAETVNLGLGDDVFNALWPHWETDVATPEQLTILGGAGADDIRVRYTYGLDPDMTGFPGLNSPVLVTVDGGDGADTILIQFDAQLYEPSDPGAPPLASYSSLATVVRGGAGADDIRVIYDFNPQPEPPGFPGIVLAGPISLSIDGGAGADTISVDVAHEPTGSSPAGEPGVVFDGAVSFDIRGGDGNDTMAVNVGPDPGDPTALEGGPAINFDRFRLRLDGEDGNDTVSATLNFNEQSTGSMDVQVLGGAGKDDLTLRAGRFPANFDLLLDGGDGIDTGHFTPNVQAVNCER